MFLFFRAECRVDLGLQHADVGQIAVSLRVIQPVADHKFIRDIKAAVIHGQFLDFSSGRLVGIFVIGLPDIFILKLSSVASFLRIFIKRKYPT